MHCTVHCTALYCTVLCTVAPCPRGQIIMHELLTSDSGSAAAAALLSLICNEVSPRHESRLVPQID